MCTLSLFKYISCFGSTYKSQVCAGWLSYLNTSHVSVQPVKSTNQIRNNLCIPCNSTIPNIFPNRKQHLIIFVSPCRMSLFYNTFTQMSLKNDWEKYFPLPRKQLYYSTHYVFTILERYKYEFL